MVNFYLQRITRFDDNAKKLNAVVQLNKNAISQAKALDKHFLKYGFKGPLHGIPILLKDNIDTLDGMANTAGSYLWLITFLQMMLFYSNNLKHQER